MTAKEYIIDFGIFDGNVLVNEEQLLIDFAKLKCKEQREICAKNEWTTQQFKTLSDILDAPEPNM